MEHNVIAEIEIEDIKIEYYTSVILRQKFNEHHEFIIRINHDVLEARNSFSAGKAQKLIGKSTIIRLKKIAVADEVTYEFRGIICEISLEQSDGFTGDLILKGHSPTILFENGDHLTSFYKSNLKKIVEKVTESLSENNFIVKVNNQYKKEIKYICQYRESSFHFLNRLSSDFSKWFYYDGTDIIFGKPSSSKNIDITYGEDVNSIQLTLRIRPMTFSNYSYNSKDDKVLNFDAPAQIDGLDEYANYVLKESNKVFNEPVNFPLRQRVENKSDLQDFVKKQKAALAADLEVLTGSSDNPSICIGAVANISISRWEDFEYKKEEHGKFLITSIEHHISENGKYYNMFEALPAGQEVIPVKNIVMPLAEPQIATVKDNKDPDNMGRVRVQMLWQKDNEMTDWLRVMTPDAGGGKGGAKNRGLVVVPEAGDQVLICFRYNDPDRPFVLGSMFHGKTGGGGGSGNKSKSLTSLSGSVVSLDGDAISIVDAAGNKINLDGGGNITINCSASITLECGGSKITMDSGGKIGISGTEITVHGSSKAVMKSAASFTAEGTSATVTAATTQINGDTKATLKSGTAVEIGSPSTDIKGDMTLKLEGAATQINGTTTTDIKGGSLMLRMNNEHNPIAHLITKIQQKWMGEISPFPQYKLIRWLIRAGESKLFEGFVHLESTPNGKLQEIFVALLTEFKSLETYSGDLINTWLDAYVKDQKTFDTMRANGFDFSWDDAYFKKQLKASENDFDHLLLKVFSTFHEALKRPLRKLVVVLMPVSVSNIASYKQWLKRIMKIQIPPNVQVCIFDYIDERFFDSVFNEFDPLTTKTLLLELDLKGATNKIIQSGDPNSPPVQLRNYLLKMSEASAKKDISKLDKLGNECTNVMTKSRNKLLMTSAYIMYAGMLFNFKKYDEIDVLLQKGLKIAQAGKASGDIGCQSIISQYYGYIASNYQLNKKYNSAVECFCMQAQILIEQTLMAPAIAVYGQASAIAKRHVAEQTKQILHKAFITGENLKTEELSGSDYNILCKDYYILLRQNNETDLFERVDKRMNDVAGKNWKEQISSQQKRFSMSS